MQASNFAEEKPHGLRHDFIALARARSAVIDLNEWECTTVQFNIGDKCETISIHALRHCVETNTDTHGIAEQVMAAFTLAVSGGLSTMKTAYRMDDGNIFVQLGNATALGQTARLVRH
jgi:hypothetical protein